LYNRLILNEQRLFLGVSKQMTGIFLIQDSGELVEMTEQQYITEDHLQELLAKYPNLLVGDQISTGSPRRWLLVKREMRIPSEEGGSDRWSLDHLFLDQDGIPTLVEVKRSSDTRIRREVVGQMLDYAANGVVYWPVEQIRAEFEKNCALDGRDPQLAIVQLVGHEIDEQEFWQQVKTNLYAGKIRMLFVADKIPDELKRIVEFLNSQMSPAEVLAVEVRQYTSGSLKTLVPRLIGNTAEADNRKGRSSQHDLTRFDITVDGITHTNLPKRTAILTVVKHLCDDGVPPEAVADLVPWKKNTMFRRLAGNLGSNEFLSQVQATKPPPFDSKRYFCNDNELIHHGDMTYAFTNQWGDRTVEAIRRIIEAHPEHPMVCVESGTV
jgi:hypothetical protein